MSIRTTLSKKRWCAAQTVENNWAHKKWELGELLARDKELDMLFERLYKDNVFSRIDDTRFSKMSKRYKQK